MSDLYFKSRLFGIILLDWINSLAINNAILLIINY